MWPDHATIFSFYSGKTSTQRSQTKEAKNDFHIRPNPQIRIGVPAQWVHFPTQEIWVGRGFGFDWDTNQNMVSKQAGQRQTHWKGSFRPSVQVREKDSHSAKLRAFFTKSIFKVSGTGSNLWRPNFVHWMLLQTWSLWQCSPRNTHPRTSTSDTKHGTPHHTITYFNPTNCPSNQKLNTQIIYVKIALYYKILVTTTHILNKKNLQWWEKCSSFHFLSPISFDENAYGNWNARHSVAANRIWGSLPIVSLLVLM